MLKARTHYLTRVVIAGLLVLFLAPGCSTKKNTLVNRSFHNLTSHFNGYFYANESFKEGVDILEKAHKDNYDKILPVFKYGKPEDAKAIYPQMDKTFKKSSAVIERHSMLIKGKEYVKWIDENYLLIGKSHFYKRDYFAGLEVLDYVSRQYKNQESRFDARIWMIRTYNELGIFDQASTLIDLLNEDKLFPKRLHPEFAAVQADFFLKQELYTQAEFFLTKAMALAPNKKKRARYAFILAQVKQKQNKTKDAHRLYSKVIALHPSYEMTFAARMNLARTTEAGEGSKLVKKQLQKMLKDAKNIEYLDQIYFALAEIAIKEGDQKAAVDYLKLSTKTSIGNNDQKAKSFLKLADISFDKAEYPMSQAYYDSALTLVSKDFPGYELLSERKKTLTALVNNQKVIYVEDSLLKLSKMTEAERIAFVDAIVAKLEEEEKRRKEEEEAAKLNASNIGPMSNQANQVTQTTQGGGSSWYFYNPSTLSFGLSEFLKKWGNRKLEDNWRRSNKQTIITDETGAVVAVVDSVNEAEAAITAVATAKDKAGMLKNIPVTDEQKQRSENRIIEAYYSIGFIYKEELLNEPKAIITFEELLRRYPKNKYTLPLYYQLYRLHANQGNKEQSEKYKNTLLRDHPETEYAQILKNPEYLEQSAAKGSEAEQLYRSTLIAYTEKRFNEVQSQYETAQQKYAKTKLFPRFALLNALSHAGKNDLAAYEKSLKEIIVKYPKDPVRNEAEELLNGLARVRGENPMFTDSVAPGLYAANPAAEHFVILLVKGTGFSVDKAKIKISDFNSEFFSTGKFELSSVPLNENWTMITIKTFTDQGKATDYLATIKNNEGLQKEIGSREFKFFAISIDNYPVFFKDKRIEEYEKFYSKSY